MLTHKNQSASTFIIGILSLILIGILPCYASAAEKVVDVITIDGTINPGVADYVTKSIERASKDDAECLVIEMDTPGGLDLSMRSIIKEIMNSKVPIVVYVTPSGARAASAGVLITIAAHIAAMSPGTNIGAAHPVTIGGEKIGKEMSEKMTNDAAAYIESIALKRNRNADWAIKAVRKSVSITEQEALRLKVIDLISPSLEKLLEEIDGRTVVTPDGQKVLRTKGATIKRSKMGIRSRILDTISNPNIAYILMMIGLVGLYFELSNPGAILPGVLGGICLILAFFAFQTLSVNYAGILLILLAVIFFIAEIKVQSFGLLAVGGIISLLLGSMMLFESPNPELRLSWKVLIPTVALASSFFLVTAGLAFKAYRKKPATGSEGLIGMEGIAETDITPDGKVFVHGENWNASSDEMIARGAKVIVLEVKGLTLKVRKK
ncbi:MAG: nodulation protein NfeD [Proteobacteria bacterium]|nr:nodulation protein NfeD [Pseudomonadota bacterium]